MSSIFKQQKQVIEKWLSASSRVELVDLFTQWINEWPYDHYIRLSVHGIIGDVPYEVPDDDGLINKSISVLIKYS